MRESRRNVLRPDLIGNRNCKDDFPRAADVIESFDYKTLTIIIAVEAAPSFTGPIPIHDDNPALVIKDNTRKKRERDRGQAAINQCHILAISVLRILLDQLASAIDIEKEFFWIYHDTILALSKIHQDTDTIANDLCGNCRRQGDPSSSRRPRPSMTITFFRFRSSFSRAKRRQPIKTQKIIKAVKIATSVHCSAGGSALAELASME